ncbi:hypothetical protein ISS30_05580 [bacterium]|nr:hypothetical protein [bacterium]
MKLIGFLSLLFGGALIALFVIKHLVLFLLSGSPLLVKGGILFIALGLIILLAAVLLERRKQTNLEDVER